MTAPTILKSADTGTHSALKHLQTTVELVADFKFSAIANTAGIDRDGEVVLPQGCKFDNYMKNPVMLDIHNYRARSVGRVDKIDVSDKVTFDFTFADTESGRELAYLYSNKMQSAFSVGFIPKEYVIIDSNTPEKFSLHIEGKDVEIDLGIYPERPYVIFTSWELLEISPVPVPSNPEALLLGKASSTIAGSKSALKHLALKRASDITDALIKQLSDESYLYSPVIPYQKSLEVIDSDDKAALNVVKFALPKGSTEVKDINFVLYSSAFAYVDPLSASKTSGYKLLHHSTGKDSSLALVKSSLYSSMCELLSNQKSFGDHVKDIYDHLSSHYKDINQIPPELKEYPADQLILIGKGTEIKTVAPVLELPDESFTELKNLIKGLSSTLDSYITDSTIQFQLLGEKVAGSEPAPNPEPVEESWLLEAARLSEQLKTATNHK